MDAVKDEIVARLKAEQAALLHDIDYLQALLGNNLDEANAIRSAPPALHELKVRCM